MSQTFIEILRRALDEELARDPAVHLLGEDVAAGGGRLIAPARGVVPATALDIVRHFSTLATNSLLVLSSELWTGAPHRSSEEKQQR